MPAYPAHRSGTGARTSRRCPAASRRRRYGFPLLLLLAGAHARYLGTIPRFFDRNTEPGQASTDLSGDRHAAQLLHEGSSRPRDRGSARLVIQHDQLTAVNIGDHSTGFLTHQQSTQVVPDTVSVDAAIQVPVENTAGHCAQVEGDRAKSPVLGPTQMPVGIPGETDDGVSDPGARGGMHRLAVSPSPSPAHGFEAGATGLMGDDGGSRTGAIDRARTGGEPGDAPPRVRRAVEGIEHDHDVAIGMA
jgi:hypothetical protein